MSKEKEFLENRILEIQKAVNESATQHKSLQGALEQAAAHHNSLMGRLSETQFLLSELFRKEIECNPEGGPENASS